MEREQTGLSGLLLVLSGCYLVLSACSEDEGEWNGSNAGEGNGFNATELQLSAQRRVLYRSGRRSAHDYRHHWPIFVSSSQDILTRGYFLCHAQTRQATLRVNM